MIQRTDKHALEHQLVAAIRRGRSEKWGELLAIYESRIIKLASDWNIDESVVAEIVVKKLQLGVERYNDGTMSFWAFVKITVQNALRDHLKLVENQRKVMLDDIPEHEEHGFGGRLAYDQQFADVDTLVTWLQPHRECCRALITHSAAPEIRQLFREFLNTRRSQRVIQKSAMLTVLGELGLPDPQGRRILQQSLFMDGFMASLVDDYCLLGERILKLLVEGVRPSLLAGILRENPRLVSRFLKVHFRVVATIVASANEH